MTQFQNPMATPPIQPMWRDRLQRAKAGRRKLNEILGDVIWDPMSRYRTNDVLLFFDQLIEILDDAAHDRAVMANDAEVRALAREILLSQRFVRDDMNDEANTCLHLAHRLLSNPIPGTANEPHQPPGQDPTT